MSLRVGRSGVRERILRDAGQERADRDAHLRAEFAVVLSRPDDDNHYTLRAHRTPDQTELQALARKTDAGGRARRDQTDPVEKVNSENARYVCIIIIRLNCRPEMLSMLFYLCTLQKCTFSIMVVKSQDITVL